MRRRVFLNTTAAGAVIWPLVARAQQTGPTRRVSVIMALAETDPQGPKNLAAFVEGMKTVGWTGGRNLALEIEWTGGDPDRVDTAVNKALAFRPDVLVAQTPFVCTALKRKAGTTPIVFVAALDPVAEGLVTSLARPGGNVTGFTFFEPSIVSKWLELLLEIKPGMKRVGMIGNPAVSGHDVYREALEAAAPPFGVQVVDILVQDEADIEHALGELAKPPEAGLIVPADVFLFNHSPKIIALAAKYRLPAIYAIAPLAARGSLIVYGLDVADLFRRSASYVDRILRGAKPADLPVQNPTKYDLIINLKTAKALGLTVPPSLLATADQVIE